MQDEQLLERITLESKIMTGKPVIRGTRLTVEYILNLLAHGATEAEILEEYKGLVREDIQACLLFASQSLQSSLFLPLVPETA
jgi:uncharacterized protein (DUF433 family)